MSQSVPESAVSFWKQRPAVLPSASALHLRRLRGTRLPQPVPPLSNTEKFGRLRQNIRQHEEDHIQTFVLTRLLHKRQHTVLQLSKLLCIQELI